MKSIKFVLVIVIVLVLAGAAVYVVKLGPMGVQVLDHEVKIVQLEKRATSAEQKLDEHDKRIAVLESSVKAQGQEISRTQADLAAARIELSQAQEKLEQHEGRLSVVETERAKLAEEVTLLRKRVEHLEKDLVKRIEVLEKLTEGKVQK